MFYVYAIQTRKCFGLHVFVWAWVLAGGVIISADNFGLGFEKRPTGQEQFPASDKGKRCACARANKSLAIMALVACWNVVPCDSWKFHVPRR